MTDRPGRLDKKPSHGRISTANKTAGPKQTPSTAQEKTSRTPRPQRGQNFRLPNRLIAREKTRTVSLQCGHFMRDVRSGATNYPSNEGYPPAPQAACRAWEITSPIECASGAYSAIPHPVAETSTAVIAKGSAVRRNAVLNQCRVSRPRNLR